MDGAKKTWDIMGPQLQIRNLQFQRFCGNLDQHLLWLMTNDEAHRVSFGSNVIDVQTLEGIFPFTFWFVVSRLIELLFLQVYLVYWQFLQAMLMSEAMF